MRLIILLLTIGSFAACNNNGAGTTDPSDSLSAVDSTTLITPDTSTMTTDSMSTMTPDTTSN